MTEPVQADGNNMEDEVRTTETEQGDVVNNEGESSGEVPNDSPVKRGRGRPQGSKKLKVTAISNGGSTQSPRQRGRPKVSKPTEQEGSGYDHADNSEQTPKKRGRPRLSLSKNTDAKDLPNGESDTPKARRGRPKGSTKRKSESDGNGEAQGGSLEKKPRLETEGKEDAGGSRRRRGRPRKVETTSNGISAKPRRGRGRPKLIVQKSGDGSQPIKRGRGRPKGSLNKNPPAYKVHSKVGRPKSTLPTKGRPGRPKKQPAKRGRPRKHPLPSPEELKKPRVWKPLGRPRKYPRVDPPEGSQPAPRRGRGRPFKSESKKGAHLRKSLPASDVGSPRKRGRPPVTPKSDDGTQRRRGRPKGSVNKNKAVSETQLDSELPNNSKAESDSSPVGVEHVEPAEEEVGHDVEVPSKNDTETAIEHEENTEESLIDQGASFEVSNQA